ncbi:hypothetical protein WJ0W_005875 [Paenibacillus melissococcoides]|uniref:Uncharacterized protein n=1 Tax=Paenibacillus melissococcoides TaxID=2912268 RepID=A0ABM9G9N2_9BACL|nr:hypothetical protein WJ0W_005875 [Paenibacillus melissococcoides]
MRLPVQVASVGDAGGMNLPARRLRRFRANSGSPQPLNRCARQADKASAIGEK